MSDDADPEILDVTDEATFERVPPCADPRFDHRSCDYWEDPVRGSKDARPDWWQPAAPQPRPKPRPRADNPFAPAADDVPSFNPFDPSSTQESSFNPFAPARSEDDGPTADTPAKLRLLVRGRGMFGSFAKVLLLAGVPTVYAQFGPLSAYPRAQRVRDLYPTLPSAPLPAVITCIATTPEARGHGLAQALVDAVAVDLAARGFAAVEAYPDMTLAPDEASAADPAFWEACGFAMAAPDERFPVMRRTLD